MALKKDIVIHGQTYITDNSDASNIYLMGESSIVIDTYIKVSSFSGNKEKMKFDVSYINKDTNIIMYIKNYYLTIELKSTRNTIEQCYDYLKTLDEFKDAEDC